MINLVSKACLIASYYGMTEAELPVSPHSKLLPSCSWKRNDLGSPGLT